MWTRNILLTAPREGNYINEEDKMIQNQNKVFNTRKNEESRRKTTMRQTRQIIQKQKQKEERIKYAKQAREI